MPENEKKCPALRRGEGKGGMIAKLERRLKPSSCNSLILNKPQLFLEGEDSKHKLEVVEHGKSM